MDPPAAAIRELDVDSALARQRAGIPLVDVREPGEWALGSPTDAWRIPLDQAAEAVAARVPALDSEILLICASGIRSRRAAEALAARGYRRLASVTGGFTQWRARGLPFESPSALEPAARERYSRHLLLPNVGEAGQLRLANSRVLLIGAGGLGSPSALYLAAAGVGTLRIADDDRVDLSNLQRQVLHDTPRVGWPKVRSAEQTLRALNPLVRIEAREERAGPDNIARLLEGVDVVLDGADNFATRYLLNAACVESGTPLVYGAVQRFEGQVSVFWPAQPGGAGPCYRCLFPEPPAPGDAPNCAEAGVLGVMPGLIGMMQATEVIKLLLGIGEPLVGRVLCVDALGARYRELALARDPDCPGCGPERRPVVIDGALCSASP